MALIELSVERLRCVHQARLDLHPRHNLLWGANGAGKTSLLEGIFLLGRGRSFRTRNSERLIKHGEPRLIVFGRTDDVPAHSLGLEVSRVSGTAARIDGTDASALTRLTETFPVQVLDPGIHKLIEEGGSRRRRWLDWVVFHVEPRFADTWVRYTRALKQRNAALKQQAGTYAWDVELAHLGETVSELRRGVLARLLPHWHDTVRALGGYAADLHYAQGWPQDLTLAEALSASRPRDLQRGVTHTGPHRADVQVLCGSRAAREVLSRGQQKVAAIAMTLSQVHLLGEVAGITPTLLLDDPAAELDATHLRYFIEEINRLSCQLVLTSLHADGDPFGKPERVFHVEQGEVAPV